MFLCVRLFVWVGGGGLSGVVRFIFVFFFLVWFFFRLKGCKENFNKNVNKTIKTLVQLIIVSAVTSVRMRYV